MFPPPGHNIASPEILSHVIDAPPSPSLFALIIGINKYKDPDVRDLCGSVADADAVQDFLTSKVGVAKDRIVNLRDEEATREAMVNAIQNLACNPAISTHDPILIFYAGHGSEASPPYQWETSSANGKIQMLCPHDFAFNGSKDGQGQGIFDLTLSKLLSDIARNKSDNITIILDNCHSGSGTRTTRPDESFCVRSIELPQDYTIPSSFLGSDRSTAIAPNHEHSGLRSHVLLAACMPGQTARENGERGLFTSALLCLLQNEPIEQLTYKDVITRIGGLPSDQNPQCEGLNQDRILFNSRVVRPYRKLYSIRVTPDESDHYTLEAGEAHGVTKNAEFSVYSDKTVTTFLGSVVAHDTNSYTTRCFAIGAPFSLSQPAYAVQACVGRERYLRLFIEDNVAFSDLSMGLDKETQRIGTNRRSFQLLNSADDNPDFALSIRDDFVQFEVMAQIRAYGLTHMPFHGIRANETDYLVSILRSAADFYQNLRHTNEKGGVLTQKVSVECLKLVSSEEVDDNFSRILVPDPNGQNLNVGGTIIVNVEEKMIYHDVEEPVKYGYKIHNRSTTPLYAALFYFDPSDLSIQQYYSPVMGANGKAEFSLPSEGSLTIGFGDGGMPPYNYYLREGQSVDVGLLKLYLSRVFIDYFDVAQESPFKRSRSSEVCVPKPLQLWDTLTTPIIQRRGAAQAVLNGSTRSGAGSPLSSSSD